MRTLTFLLPLSVLLVASCRPAEEPGAASTHPTSESAASAASLAPLDPTELRTLLGRELTENDGRYKVTVPQNDLNVSVDGFEIVPPMGLGSWAAFAPAPEGAVVMGDLVLLETEIAPVERILFDHGLAVSGLHNHFIREDPDVMFLHLAGTGSAERLARGVRAALDEVARLRGGDPAAGELREVESDLDDDALAAIVGHEGSWNRGVYKMVIGRPDVALELGGTPVTTFQGFNTWIAWQGDMQKAAVAGDFTMLEDEVAAVTEALVEHGIEVVALHNHMVREQPRMFFLHFWGVGPAEDLARGLRAALEASGSEG